MKRFLMFLIIILISSVAFATLLSVDEIQELDEKGILRKFGISCENVVSKKETAIKIAEAVAHEVYGDKIKPFLPFDANEDEHDSSLWIVKGPEYKPFKNAPYVQVGPIIKVRKYDGAITLITFSR